MDWCRMILPKKERRISLQDLVLLAQVANIKRAIEIMVGGEHSFKLEAS